MSITTETRREAYYEAREEAPTRRKQIYQALRERGPMTAEELMGALGYSDPNSVRPRLTELKALGLVSAERSRRNKNGRSVAIWEAVIHG